MNLATQSVFITGGTRGIGFELAKAFTARGSKVAICGRSADHVSDAKSQLPDVMASQCDLSDIDALPGFVNRLRLSFGAPTILVNNAGIQFNQSWLESSSAERLAQLKLEVCVNLTSTLALTALLLDDLVRGGAAVVNVSSLLALKPKRSAPVYCATKAAIRSFSKALRYQLEPYPNVRVVEVVPPLVDTGMTEGRGTGKISAAQAASEIVRGLEHDLTEIYVGKAKILRLLDRLVPSITARLLRDG